MELFDLEQAPRDLETIANESTERVDALQARIEEVLRAAEALAAQHTEQAAPRLDKRTIERLRAPGYLE